MFKCYKGNNGRQYGFPLGYTWIKNLQENNIRKLMEVNKNLRETRENESYINECIEI